MVEYIYPARKGHVEKWKGSCIDMACRPLVINGYWLFEGLPDTDLLKDSLSETLTLYYPLAGRMNGNEVLCNGAGVGFEAVDFPKIAAADIPKSILPDKKFHACYDAKGANSGKTPLMSVKISRLADAAILNVKCSHFCADGKTFYAMMNAWAAIARGENVSDMPEYNDSSVLSILAASDLYKRVMSGNEMAESLVCQGGMQRIRSSAFLSMMWQNVSGTMRRQSGPCHVSEDRITAMQEAVMSKHGVRVGRNAVLSAISFGILKERFRWSGREISLVHTADHRERIAGLGKNYAGNAAFVLRPTVFSADLPAEDVAVLVENDLRQMLSSETEAEYFPLYCLMLEKKLPYLPFDVVSMWRRNPATFIVNNCLKFNVYGMNFGTGFPAFAWQLDFPDPVRFWPAPNDLGGIYLYFAGNFT